MSKHARQRATERYGLDDTAYDALKARLAAGEGVVAKTERAGREQRLIEHDGQMIRVVWKPMSGAVITFPPLHRKPPPGCNGKRPAAPRKGTKRADRRPAAVLADECVGPAE